MLRRDEPQEMRLPKPLSEVARKNPPPVASPIPRAPSATLPVASGASRLNDPALTVADDLAYLTVLMREYRRHLGGNPVGDNDEITAALLGANSKQIACLPAEGGTYLDKRNHLIDRWGNPYFFHAQSATEMEILSAGPDGILYTADDFSSQDIE